MKKTKLNRWASIMLAAVILLTSMPIYTFAAGSGVSNYQSGSKLQATESNINVKNATDAMSHFTDALRYFNTEVIREFYDNGMQLFSTRLCGVTSLASGVVGILQLTGVIKDPTREMLGQILDEVYRIEEQIEQIDKKLDDLHAELVQVAVSQVEIDRSTKTTQMIGYWNDFNSNYCEPLDDMMNEYQGMVNEGIQSWWTQSSHDGVRVLYTVIDGKPELTYPDSQLKYDEGIPNEAGNGEAVDKDQSFGVPAELIPDTKALTFKIDSYRSLFENVMASRIKAAADAKEIDANEEFYKAWNALSDSEKNNKAKIYASDVLNTQIYLIACKVMSENDSWVIKVTNAYRKYCDNILKQNSGINAMLNAMYLSHGFEGEIKEDLNTFCNGMIVKAGMYGQFAITCVCQDDLQNLSNREAVRKQFADTVNSLEEKKKYAITGKDNYCYITGTKVMFKTVGASSTINLQAGNSASRDIKIGDWKIDLPNIMNTVYFQVLYDQYKTTGRKQNISFVSYLKNNGTEIPENYDGIIMSKYGGAKVFDLHDGLEMKRNSAVGISGFGTDKSYRINVGNEDIKDSYFKVHDLITYEGIDTETGTLVQNNKAARALYYEIPFPLFILFTALCTDNVKETYSITEVGYNTYSYSFTHTANLDVLELEPLMEMNGDDSPEDPFYAFGSPVLTEGVSDWIGPTYQDNRKALTSVSFKKSSYAYNGKPIKPAVIVKAGKKTVPASSYTVSYSDNTELGYGTVTVTAKGKKYSGMIIKSFKIVPKGTALKTVRKKGTKATVKWKKQSAKMPSDRISGYQIRYSTKSSMKNAKTVTIKSYKKTSQKITGLKKGKKYYFQIRTYMKQGDEILYSRWSGKKNAE